MTHLEWFRLADGWVGLPGLSDSHRIEVLPARGETRIIGLRVIPRSPDVGRITTAMLRALPWVEITKAAAEAGRANG